MNKVMTKKQKGFSLIELMITILISAIVVTAASSVFNDLYTQSRQQAAIAESNESMIGIELLRRDIENAGYGLPWSGLTNYSESATNLFGLNDAPIIPPKPLMFRNNAVYSGSNAAFNGSDYLVIRASNVAPNDVAQKWTYVRQGNEAKEWSAATGTAPSNFDNNDRVIVLGAKDKTLKTDGMFFYTTYNKSANPDRLANPEFAPKEESDTWLVYGINDQNASTPKRPFNRSDYYVAKSSTMPARCAPNTGSLYKAEMIHDAEGTYNQHPIVDCVADLQVIFGIDNDGDNDFETGAGSTDSYANDLSVILPLTAEEIRKRVKEVKLYILTHEGRKDPNYTHGKSVITVGEFGLGRDVDLEGNLNYRWRIYQLSVRPYNMSFTWSN